jgi:hypothetical protein
MDMKPIGLAGSGWHLEPDDRGGWVAIRSFDAARIPFYLEVMPGRSRVHVCMVGTDLDRDHRVTLSAADSSGDLMSALCLVLRSAARSTWLSGGDARALRDLAGLLCCEGGNNE